MRGWIRGRSAAGSASPCQGEGRGFESRRPLGGSHLVPSGRPASVEWPRGEATACKAVYTGSNPVSTSQHESSTRERPATPFGRSTVTQHQCLFSTTKGDWRSLASALP